MVRLLVDAKCSVNEVDKSFFQPMHYAAKNGHARVVELLLQHDDIDSSDSAPYENGMKSPLSLAVQGGHKTIVGLLLDAKYSHPGGLDTKGQTPLKYASKAGNTEIVRRLLADDRIDVNYSNTDGDLWRC